MCEIDRYLSVAFLPAFRVSTIPLAARYAGLHHPPRISDHIVRIETR
jgi:hypothetical protein